MSGAKFREKWNRVLGEAQAWRRKTGGGFALDSVDDDPRLVAARERQAALMADDYGSPV